MRETPGTEEDIVQTGLRGKLVRGPDIVMVNELRGGVLDGNKALVDEVDRGLARLSRGRLAELERRWLIDPDDRHYQSRGDTVTLDESEVIWLSLNPVLRVGNEMDWPPFDFMEGDKASGYSIDYMRLIADKVGLKLEFVNGKSWSELLAMLERGELHVLPVIADTPERRQYAAFTRHYIINPTALVTREEEAALNDIGDLAGKRLAIVKDYYYEATVREGFPDITVVAVDGFLAGLEAVAHGRADAFIGSQSVIHYTLQENTLAGLRIAGRSGIDSLDRMRLKMAVPKADAILVDILEKGMDLISETERQALADKWLPQTEDQAGTRAIALSAAEREWLVRNPRLKLGVDPAWPPFEFFDEDNIYSGLASSYVAAIGERLDVQLLPLQGLTWSEVMERARAGDIDILPAVTVTPERLKFLSFTEPYHSFPVVVATQQSAPFISGLEALDGERVGVVKDYFIEEILTHDPRGSTLWPLRPWLKPFMRSIAARSWPMSTACRPSATRRHTSASPTSRSQRQPTTRSTSPWRSGGTTRTSWNC